MIYRTLKLGFLSLVLATALFGSTCLIPSSSVWAQASDESSLFLPLIAGSPQKSDANWFSEEAARAQAEAEALDQAIQEMDQHVSIKDGLLVYDSIAAISTDVSQETQQLVMEMLDETNRALSVGEIAIEDINGSDTPETDNTPGVLSKCGGKTKTEYKQFYIKQHLDSCRTDDLISSLKLSKTTASACIYLAPLIRSQRVIKGCKIIKFTAEVMALLLAHQNAGNSGTILYFTPNGILFNIKSQPKPKPPTLQSAPVPTPKPSLISAPVPTLPNICSARPRLEYGDGFRSWGRSWQQGNVKQLQRLLTSKSFHAEADGYFGDDTTAAVKKFQDSRGLTVDGIVGRNTWSKLCK